MSAPKIIYITPAPEGGFVEFWAEHPSAARGDVAYIPQKGATKMQAEIDALKAELAELKAPPKVLSAEDVTEPGWYWHTRKGWGGDWFIHKVVRYGVLDELHTLGNCFSYDRLDGQFVGPLKAPEV